MYLSVSAKIDPLVCKFEIFVQKNIKTAILFSYFIENELYSLTIFSCKDVLKATFLSTLSDCSEMMTTFLFFLTKWSLSWFAAVVLPLHGIPASMIKGIPKINQFLSLFKGLKNRLMKTKVAVLLGLWPMSLLDRTFWCFNPQVPQRRALVILLHRGVVKVDK